MQVQSRFLQSFVSVELALRQIQYVVWRVYPNDGPVVGCAMRTDGQKTKEGSDWRVLV